MLSGISAKAALANAAGAAFLFRPGSPIHSKLIHFETQEGSKFIQKPQKKFCTSTGKGQAIIPIHMNTSPCA
jgi:hypothetical protein